MNKTGRSTPNPFLYLTCEHASRAVPSAYRNLFRSAVKHRPAHNFYDTGAGELTHLLGKRLLIPFVCGRYTRLLVDLNRSATNGRGLFSSITKKLDGPERKKILDRYYRPYRDPIEQRFLRESKRGSLVVHFSIHSFTPVFRRKKRNADVGVLFDPSRKTESRVADLLIRCIRERSPGLTVRRNYPYRGTSDGVTRHIRQLIPDDRYAGIELEINQKFPMGSPGKWRRLQETLADSLQDLIDILWEKNLRLPFTLYTKNANFGV